MDHFNVDSPGAVISVRQSIDSGEPLLLLHGGPGVPDYMYDSTVPMLPQFRVIGFDQRGVGGSKCLDERFDLAAYLEDIESIRTSMGIDSWHVFGHSWGGLLAQAYTSAHVGRVRSLVLSSSSLGVGDDWKRTKRESFHIEHARAGLTGTIRFYAFGSSLIIPGTIGTWAMRHVMTETWHNYFLVPRSAPDPDPQWLAGCSRVAMIKTDRAISKEHSAVLQGAGSFRGPVLVVYGAFDIFEDGAGIVRRRFPHATQVTLENSGHVHWLQNPSGYATVLREFYDEVSGRE
ncbi:alpha/beta hydrolase [Lacisediminihabitans sp.]|jgi:proline iminopeptidase|uniref:alpha/beta fold hydrolase n=1 Tax=Lacisediminihabitans sp. TaxID=2787631 RepID=UPI002F95921D